MRPQILALNVKQTHDQIYLAIYNYFINLFCNYPPIDKKSKRFYKRIFQNFSNHLYWYVFFLTTNLIPYDEQSQSEIQILKSCFLIYLKQFQRLK